MRNQFLDNSILKDGQNHSCDNLKIIYNSSTNLYCPQATSLPLYLITHSLNNDKNFSRNCLCSVLRTFFRQKKGEFLKKNQKDFPNAMFTLLDFITQSLNKKKNCPTNAMWETTFLFSQLSVLCHARVFFSSKIKK